MNTMEEFHLLEDGVYCSHPLQGGWIGNIINVLKNGMWKNMLSNMPSLNIIDSTK